jgi:signal transduction histidine kinase
VDLRPGGRLRQLDPHVVDVLVVIGAFVVQVAGATVAARDLDEGPLPSWAFLLLAAEAAPLLLRRRSPALTLALCGLAGGIYGAAELPDPLLELPLLIAVFTVADRCDRRTSYLLAGVGIAFAVVFSLLAGDSGPDDYYRGFLTGVVAWTFGKWHRTSTQLVAELEHRADDLERRQAEDARRAVAEERTHIARELHDIVAHHVSMVVVQAEAGAATVASSTAGPSAEAAFDGIAATGREALDELRRLLGVLRDEGDVGLATTPQPALDRVGALVDQMRATGLSVELRVEGEPRRLPDGMELSAYRIVQEALTNVVRHAGVASTSVVVRYAPDAVEVEVVDDGTGVAVVADGAAAPAGHGLIGIRERVALFGGDLRVGGRPGGGFEVAAHLPTGASR